MRTTVFVLAAVALVSASCQREPSTPTGDDSPAGIAAGIVQATRVAEGIRLANGTNQPIAYAVWARGFLGLFGPCTDDGPQCPRLAPGTSVTVALDKVVGMWPGEREVSVRWWHVVPDGAGGARADEVREIVVPLSSGTLSLPAGAPGITGVVTAITDSARMLRVEEHPEDRLEDGGGSDKAVVRVPAGAPILDRAGVRREFGELRVGMRVSVWFDGPVLESYPVQATAAAVVIEPAS